MIRDVLRMGDPRLYQQSKPVSHFGTRELQNDIRDMWDTMVAFDGAGISAPQIGIMKQIVIFGVPTPRYKESSDVPETIIINPEITVLDDTHEEYWESCLSVPGFRGLVSRPRRIYYKGYDPEGGLIEREASGFHARVVQHEVDHLEGLLFPMRLSNMAFFGCEEEIGYNRLMRKAMRSA